MKRVNSADLNTKYRSIIASSFDSNSFKSFTAYKEADPVAISLPMQWRHIDRNIEFNLNAWRFLEPFWGKLFCAEDKLCEISPILTFMRDWQKYTAKSRYNMAWYDMATGIRALHISLAFDVQTEFQFDLCPDQKEFLYVIRDSHIARLEDPRFLSNGNHGVHQMIGLYRLASVSELNETVSYARKMLVNIINESFDNHGVNTENSPFYHQYNLQLLSRIIALNDDELSSIAVDLRKKASAILPWLTAPCGTLYPIGDTEGPGVTLKSNDIKGASTFKKSIAFIDLHKSGYQIVRSIPTTRIESSFAFVFHATNKTHIHSHADQLSFLLYHKGIPIITDPGKYTYERNEWGSYFRSDRAHNTIGLKDNYLSPTDIEINSACLAPLKIINHAILLNGNAKKASIGMVHARSIVIRNRSTLLIVDKFKNPQSKPVEMRLHFGQSIDCRLVDSGSFILSSNNEEVALLSFSQDFDHQLIRGREKPSILGWLSHAYNSKEPTTSLLLTFGRMARWNRLTINLL